MFESTARKPRRRILIAAAVCGLSLLAGASWAVPNVAIADVTHNEGNVDTTPFVFTVTLDAASGVQVSVDYTTQDGTAKASTDYAATSGTLVFTPGQTMGQITVQVNGDTRHNVNRTFSVNLSNAQNASIADAQAIGTIVDDDLAPNLSIGDVTQDEGDIGTSAFQFQVTLDAVSSLPVTMQFTTQDGTATAPADYVATSGTLTIAPNDPGETMKTITVYVIGNLTSGPDKTFKVVLSNVTGANLINDTGTGSILDDDVLPSLVVSDASVLEGQSGTTVMTFNVTLSAVSGQQIDVDYATADGTATVADGDYLAKSGSLTFLPNVETVKTVSVTINGDTKVEGDETLFLNLSNADPFKVKVARGQGTGVILNDDLAGFPTDHQVRIFGNDTAGFMQLGDSPSVALAGDGNTAVFGGPFEAPGATRVFARTGYRWAQQGAKLLASDATPGAQHGYAVAIAADGNTILAGGPLDSDAGAAWVWVRNGAGWVQQAKLVGTLNTGVAQQGKSVALSADGNTALVGGPQDDNGTGAVWVFTRTNGTWSQQGAKLAGVSGGPGGGNHPKFGKSIALSADGTTALVGSPGENVGDGAARVFVRSNGVWSQQGGTLPAVGATGGANLGSSVALSADGNTALVGGPSNNFSSGGTWVFTRENGAWSLQGTGPLLGSGNVGIAAQGFAVALSADGNTALSGGLFDNGGLGATWLFKRGAGAWTEVTKLVGTLALADNPLQGASVALSANGDTAIVGAPNEAAVDGAAWIFMGANCTLDFDGDGRVDALTDGLLALRAMKGLTGTAVTNGTIAETATRTTWAQLQAHLSTRCAGGFAP